MPKIFISYRRDDSAGHTGRLYDRLTDHFGQSQIFMDVDTIQPGLNYIEVVQEAVSACDVLVAVIGRDWLQISDDAGRRRLEDPADLVKLEIATALERAIPVIPVRLADSVFVGPVGGRGPAAEPLQFAGQRSSTGPAGPNYGRPGTSCGPL